MRQPSFLPPVRKIHGGLARVQGRKLARPFSPRLPLHIVVKSERARGECSFINARHRRWIDQTARTTARRHGIRLFRLANGGNHLHLLLHTRQREALRAFLRDLSSRIAMRMTGAKKGVARGRFFAGLPWSRLVEWGRDFTGVQDYLILNFLEASGIGHRTQGLKVISPLRMRAPPAPS